ncbi:hypothetical protein EDD18DRAFT_1163843 [Armillaria luteobubalina]|uniref:Uncharacterized protein n=1 Tax=Armillaria luteobubalina TaxID=153913 RepID=A0AA39TPH1_9AGAR|nr:hypothetical protein EDD18DRAFT_1163843 [Armillaria luteobubalina]
MCPVAVHCTSWAANLLSERLQHRKSCLLRPKGSGACRSLLLRQAQDDEYIRRSRISVGGQYSSCFRARTCIYIEGSSSYIALFSHVPLTLSVFQFTLSGPLSIIAVIFFLFRSVVPSQMPFAWALRKIRMSIEETHKLFHEQNRTLSLPEEFIVQLVNLEERMGEHAFLYADPRSWIPFVSRAKQIWEDVCILRFRVDLLNIRLRMSIAGRRRRSVAVRRGSLGY